MYLDCTYVVWLYTIAILMYLKGKDGGLRSRNQIILHQNLEGEAQILHDGTDSTDQGAKGHFDGRIRPCRRCKYLY
jgi:hypothetical protein